MKESCNVKIFLVDDDPFCLVLHEEQLKKLGYHNTRTFSSGAKLLGQLHQNPAVIFLDYDLDGITGVETLKKIKLYNPLIYVVMISGQENVQIIAESFKQGAFDFIRKGEGEIQKMEKAIAKICKIQKIMSQHSK